MEELAVRHQGTSVGVEEMRDVLMTSPQIAANLEKTPLLGWKTVKTPPEGKSD